MTTLAIYIRDQAFQRLTVGAISSNWKTTRKVPLPTLQGDQLPMLAVYLMAEDMASDGDDNVSVPKYISDCTVGISVFDSAEKPEVLDGQLDALAGLALDTLLTDGTFVALVDSTGRSLIEAFPRVRRTYSFPQSGESYLMEVRIQLSVKYRCFFEPVATTPLTEVDVATQPFNGTVQTGVYTTVIPLPQS